MVERHRIKLSFSLHTESKLAKGKFSKKKKVRGPDLVFISFCSFLLDCPEIALFF